MVIVWWATHLTRSASMLRRRIIGLSLGLTWYSHCRTFGYIHSGYFNVRASVPVRGITNVNMNMFDMLTNNLTVSQWHIWQWAPDWGYNSRNPVLSTWKPFDVHCIINLKFTGLGCATMDELFALPAPLVLTLRDWLGFSRSIREQGTLPSHNSEGGTPVVEWGVRRYQILIRT